MPPALQALVVRTALATSRDSSAPLSQPPPPHPTPTAQLLRRIDDLYAAYVRIVELTCHSLQVEAAVVAASTPQESAASNRAALQRAAVEATAAFEQCAGDIQAGIRSKVQQSARIALIDHLRAEVARRRAAVDSMEKTLAIAQKHL